jgi:hypothetical protein
MIAARHRRTILAGFAAVSLLLSIAPAFAQPAPVPALPDVERRTSYSISGTTCACAVNFALYGDSTDYANWLTVWVNGVQVSQSGNWTITSPSGSLATLPRPITDAVLTFTAAQTGAVQIVGARRPRRTSQFQESQPVPTRNFNQVFSDITATLRELWDRQARTVQAPAGDTLNLLPVLASRQNMGACFDSGGNLTSCVSVPSGTFAAGNGVLFTGTNPTTISIPPAPGVDANVLNSKTANYTIATTDCGSTIQAGTGSTGFFTITLPAVAGFAGNCTVTIKNGDTGRGKSLSGFPSDLSTILWPLQTVKVSIVNGIWATIYNPGRWRWVANTTIFFDNTNGLDTNDCLAAGSGNACKAGQAAWNILAHFVDLNGHNPTLQAAAGQTYTGTGTYFILLTPLVGVGNASTGAGQVAIIDGANSTFLAPAPSGTTFASITQPLSNPVLLQNMKIGQAPGSTAGGCVGANVAGYIQIGSGIIFQECVIDLFAATGGTIQILNNFQINANVSSVLSQIGFDAQLMGNIQGPGTAITVTLSGGPNWGTTFATAGSLALLWVPSFTFSGASTGSRFQCAQNSLVLTGSGGSATYFPGNVAGTSATGCTYN